MNKKILVVEDDPGILEVIQIVLEEAGYDVLLDDGSNVYRRVEEHMPNLVLLDILLVSEDGATIAKKLKANKATSHIPLILVSADLHTEKKAQEAGADGFLRKPFNIDDLEKLVKKFLSK